MSVEQQLRQELAALRHELRRVNDSFERSRSNEFEQQARRLRDNIALCQLELKQLKPPSQ